MFEDRFSDHNQDFLRHFIGSALKYQTTNLKEIAYGMDTGAKADSNYRRIQCFFKKEMNLVGNGLFSKELLEDVLWYLRPLIREGRLEVTLMGDREFLGEKWEEFLAVHDLDYLLRVRRDYRLPDGTAVEEIYSRLKVGGTSEIKVDGWRLIVHRLESCTGRRDDCLALITLDTRSSASLLLKKYRRRWMIERGFFNMNTNGFEIKRTRITSPARLEMLVYLMMFCYFLVMVVGLLREQLYGVRIKKHGHRATSVFLNGLRTLLRMSSTSKPFEEDMELFKYLDIKLLISSI